MNATFHSALGQQLLRMATWSASIDTAVFRFRLVSSDQIWSYCIHQHLLLHLKDMFTQMSFWKHTLTKSKRISMETLTIIKEFLLKGNKI